MGRAIGTACAVLLGIAAFPAVTRAQTDYRNLDDGRPVRTEDAFVVDHHEFEVLTPFTYDAGVGGARRYIFQPELEYGIWPNTQLSVKVPIGIVDSSGSDAGVGGLQFSGIYNFNAEGPHLPAFSARADLFLPAGALAGDRTLVSLKAIATRTFGLRETAPERRMDLRYFCHRRPPARGATEVVCQRGGRLHVLPQQHPAGGRRFRVAGL